MLDANSLQVPLVVSRVLGANSFQVLLAVSTHQKKQILVALEMALEMELVMKLEMGLVQLVLVLVSACVSNSERPRKRNNSAQKTQQ